jgi:peptide methionine sulfoxide reductase MsrA
MITRNDVGTQYRSEIFYHNEEQKKTTEDYIGLMTAEDTLGSELLRRFRRYQNFMKQKRCTKITIMIINRKAIALMLLL